MDDAVTITRQVELDTTVDELWSLIADGDRWAEWLVDAGSVCVEPGAVGVVHDDGSTRQVQIRTVDDRERIAFDWWTDEEGDERSSVELEIVHTGGRTGLRVTETFTSTGVSASAVSMTSTVSTVSTAWDLRLLVLCLATAALSRT